jgi:hypothetical protein
MFEPLQPQHSDGFFPTKISGMSRKTVDLRKQAAQDRKDAARMKPMGEATLATGRREPHLLTDGRLQRCSVRNQPFFPDEKPSVAIAFAKHVLAHHEPSSSRVI